MPGSPAAPTTGHMTQPPHSPQPHAASPDTGDPSTSTSPGPGTAQATPPIPLLQPSQKKRHSKSTKVFRIFRNAFRSFPILSPACRLPAGAAGPGGGTASHDGHMHGATRMTGTLFGPRKARISLAIQENPRSLPMVLLELAIPTAKLLQEMGSGLVRIAMECEKKAADKTRLLEEPVWTMYCNGRKAGYGTRREPGEADLGVMRLLHAVSMGAGVLPSAGDEGGEPGADGELTYMRAHFDRVVGSKDSETFYMLNPDGNGGPELSIFFVRI